MCVALRYELDLLDRVVDRGRWTTVGPGERDVLRELALGSVPFCDFDGARRPRLELRGREDLDVRGGRGVVLVGPAVPVDLPRRSVHVRQDVVVRGPVRAERLPVRDRRTGRQARARDGRCLRVARLAARVVDVDLRGVLPGLLRFRRGCARFQRARYEASDCDDRGRQELETLHEADPPVPFPVVVVRAVRKFLHLDLGRL